MFSVRMIFKVCVRYVRAAQILLCELAFGVELGIVPGSDEAAMALIKKVAKQDFSIFH